MHTISVEVSHGWQDMELIPDTLLEWLEQYLGPALSRRSGYAQAQKRRLLTVHDRQNSRTLSFVVPNKTDAILFKLTWG